MENVKIVFMGTPDFSVPVLEGLIENYQVVGVVSQPDKKVGRHQELQATPVKEVALKNNILVMQPIKIRNEYQEILDLKPDLIVTCAYGQIIPEEILNYPKYGCINVHASLLPKLRGGAPIHHALIDGYQKTGITIMYMDKEMDNGDIISQKEVAIDINDNLESLHDKLKIVGRDLLLETLPSILNGTNKRIKQNRNEVTYGYNIKRDEEHIDFNRTSLEIFNQIRGLSPTPGANVIFNGKEMKVYASFIGENESTKIPGTITGIYKEGIGVSTKDKEIVLTEIKPFGKKKMCARDYANGVKDLVGQVFK